MIQDRSLLLRVLSSKPATRRMPRCSRSIELHGSGHPELHAKEVINRENITRIFPLHGFLSVVRPRQGPHLSDNGIDTELFCNDCYSLADHSIVILACGYPPRSIQVTCCTLVSVKPASGLVLTRWLRILLITVVSFMSAKFKSSRTAQRC